MSSSFPNKSGAINTNALSPFEALGQSVSKAIDPFGVTTSLLNAQMAWLMHPQEFARAVSGLSGDLHDADFANMWMTDLGVSAATLTFDLGHLKDDTRHPYRLQCEQWRLTRLLRERLAANPDVDLVNVDEFRGSVHREDGDHSRG